MACVARIHLFLLDITTRHNVSLELFHQREKKEDSYCFFCLAVIQERLRHCYPTVTHEYSYYDKSRFFCCPPANSYCQRPTTISLSPHHLRRQQHKHGTLSLLYH